MLGLNCIVALVIGGLAGFVAGRVLRGKGYGIIGNVVLGLVGSIVGSLVFGLLGFGAAGLLGRIVASSVGAVLFIMLLRVFVDAEFAR
jgi:uncharacterized membrane protein YeaQ/YmgE (transglycosylase-associated protein family)